VALASSDCEVAVEQIKGFLGLGHSNLILGLGHSNLRMMFVPSCPASVSCLPHL